MSTPEQFRAKAVEYKNPVMASADSDERRRLQNPERSFTTLAGNDQWLADNFHKTVSASDEALTGGEEQILQCLGVALIRQWDTLPTKLQRELLDNAGSMSELLEAKALRGNIARFLHKHGNRGW